MSIFPLKKNGSLEPVDTLFEGSTGGPDTERQATPHVHCTVFSPDGKYIFATDFSADRILRFDDGSYFRFPAMRWSVAHFRQLMPTVNVSRGLGAPAPLPHRLTLLAKLAEYPVQAFAGGQLLHLLGGQCHAALQGILFAEGNPLIHQGLKLLFVAGVAVKIALAGQSDDLLADQPLLSDISLSDIRQGYRSP